MSASVEAVRPFRCGSQYGDWRSRNCDRCVKSYDNQKPQPTNGMGPCDIDNAVGLAYLGSGSVTPEIGKRMGYTSSLEYGWDCPERELKGEPRPQCFRSPAGAQFSADRSRRLLLWRSWDETKPLLGFVALNPSKADENKNDPTTTRNCERARREGFGGVLMANLYDHVARHPSSLKWAGYPCSEANWDALLGVGVNCPTVVLACGAWARPADFHELVKRLRALPAPPRLVHLGLLKGGLPRHPLHTAYAVPLQEFPA
jgi:hypothetical protein